MTLPSDPKSGDPEAKSDARPPEEEPRRVRPERLREEVRRLEQAGQLAAALQAIRDAALPAPDREGFQPDVARLKQAARLQASYRRACAARDAGDPEAAALLSAVVAVDPKHEDAAKQLYETVSGVSVAGLQGEVAAAREAASLAEAERDRLRRARARLVWVAGAQGVALCFLLGWMAWRRPPPPAADGRRLPAQRAETRAAPLPAPGSPEGVASLPAPATALAQAVPVPETTVRASAPSAPVASAGPAPPGGAAAAAPSGEPPPPEPDGPCRRIGEGCTSSMQCCFGSLCYGTECQDMRRTIVFGQYRP